MSRPHRPQTFIGNSRQGQGRSRGGNRRPFRGRNTNSHRSNQERQDHSTSNLQRSPAVDLHVQQPSEANCVYDWFYEEPRPVDPNENQGRSDSRSSSPCSQSSRSSFHGPRGTRGFGRYQRGPGGSKQYNQPDRSSSKYLQFHQLMRLSKMNGNSIAIEISDNSEFIVLLNSEMKKDFLVLTLRVLAKLKQSDFTRIVINILCRVCESRFLSNLEHYLVDLPSGTLEKSRANKFYWEDINQFWNYLHDFFKILIDLIPMLAHKKLLPILELISCYIIESLKTKKDHEIDEDVLLRIRKLHDRLKEKIEKRKQIRGNQMLQDFRDMNIVPTVEDLNDYQPYIRPCKIHGAYDSVDHYLDVQFRLLREDFICPLRTGIQEYKRLAGMNERSSQVSDIRVFENVKLRGPTVVKNKVGVTIFFGKKPKINWTQSKLFMFGSLLCLTNDNFESVLFATVVDRDTQTLEKGELIIEPCLGTRITLQMYDSEYVMVESKVYFLPYYHTLSSLRYMSEENFPMKRYVVDAASDPTPPKYLDKSTIYEYKGFKFPVMDERRWPSAQHLKLDQSQYEAFKCALLQELSVLHGPPGTGKTFMALQIASTLLANSSSWYDPANPTPMIAVCLTNHALDQFLEGILPYTDSLVRVGEQSKNPNLSKYKLKTVRDNYFKDEKNKNRAWKRMSYYSKSMNKVMNALKKLYSDLRALTSDTSIVSPNVFSQYCDDDKLNGLTAGALLTNLFGPSKASLALEINVNPSDTQKLVGNDASDSEDEYVDADDDLEVGSTIDANNSELTCLEISHLDVAIQECETEIATNQSGPNNTQNNTQVTELNRKLKQLQSLRTSFQARLSEHPLLTDKGPPKYCLIDKSWENYRNWLIKSHEVVSDKVVQLEEEFQEISSQLNDFKQMTDLEVMRNSLVVGLTTTGAARLHESLRALKSPIVLVEEAAEILEAHVICSLTEHCQQVILVGDHKQLRPKPATYELEVNYNLDISLFERIIKMRDKCTQLVIQHRMRPQIAKLLSPSIYERLENHISVYTHPAVKGLEKNLFFINHQNHELGSSENESISNPYEVKFLLTFAEYLIQQGYTQEEITILCTYSGQLFKFKEAKRSMPALRFVRVTTVDNYQGEENKIILLSLVRNNRKGNIGFLRTENRVCVALSRAREGLYIMGNMENLVTRNEIWPKIRTVLEKDDAIGDRLVLQCQIHNDQYTEIKRSSDFNNSPNGGCLRKCDALLPCGHTCQKVCHLANREHESYVCDEPCMEICPNGHPCNLRCKEACKPCQEIIIAELECGHEVPLLCSTNLKQYQCSTKVPVRLNCGHIVQKPCHRESSTYPCNNDCKKSLPCGHSCVQKCHTNDDPHHLKYVCKGECQKTPVGCSYSHPCTKKCHEECGACMAKIQKERSCGHIYNNVECSKDVEKIVCIRRCKRNLPCGHPCKQKCNLPCGKCEQMVDKIVPICGHQVKLQCDEEPSSVFCKDQCSKNLECGHPCTALCCEPCTERCEYPRPLPKPSLCGHEYPVPCYKIEIGLAEYADKLLQHCATPCATLLPCGHECKGSCGSCKQGRIHQPCLELCSKFLICGHRCESRCKDPCRPCQKKCALKCEHNECEKRCGVSCTRCQQPCSRQCKHFKCKKLCFEICDKEFCDQPCPEKLKCGHSCIGFCGEPCPPLCRICNKEDLPVVFTEKNRPDPPENKKFVFLPDCGHSIKSDYLDWIWQKSCKIGIKVCPLCGVRVVNCTRYVNQIKKERKDMEIVDQRVYMKLKILRRDQDQILGDITKLADAYATYFPDFKASKPFYESLQKLVNQRKVISAGLLKDISAKLTISGMILRQLREIPHSNRLVNNWPVVLNQMIMLITSLPTTQNISYQMIDDVRNELSRLHYMIQLCKFENLDGLNDKTIALQVEIIYLGLLNLRRFTKSRGDAIYDQICELKKSLKSSVSIDQWKQTQVRIIGVEKEDWYRCSSGHIYISQCPECPTAPFEEK